MYVFTVAEYFYRKFMIMIKMKYIEKVASENYPTMQSAESVSIRPNTLS